MTNEEFQKLVLDKLVSMETEIKDVKSNMATKDDIAILDAKIDNLDTKIDNLQSATDNDVIGILQLMNKKIDQVASTQAIQGESINILAMRQLQTESELATLKKAK